MSEDRDKWRKHVHGVGGQPLDRRRLKIRTEQRCRLGSGLRWDQEAEGELGRWGLDPPWKEATEGVHVRLVIHTTQSL